MGSWFDIWIDDLSLLLKWIVAIFLLITLNQVTAEKENIKTALLLLKSSSHMFIAHAG